MKRLLLTLAIIGAMVSAVCAETVWMTDFNKAAEVATKEKKPIFILFTGSDWCGFCIRFHREFFAKDAFKSFAKEDLVLLEADFPRRKKIDAATKAQNQKLAQKYGVEGYPMVFITDAEGKVIFQSGYGDFRKAKSPEAYIKLLKEKILSQSKK
ncbi:MAG: thioredoxin family protein [Victivallaceae bacterium]|nr:thioredoxin family protein [Victivallaceae bacterium]